MKYVRSGIFPVATAVVVALFAMGPPAQANFQVIVTAYNSGGTQVGQETFTATAGSGNISIDGSSGTGSGTAGTGNTLVLGNFTLSGSGQAPPLTGPLTGAASADTTQGTLNISSSGAGKLTIAEVVNGITLSAPAGSLESAVNATAISSGATYSFQSYIDSTNSMTVGAGISPTGPQGPFTTKAGGDITATINPTIAGPFALSNIVTFVATGKGQQLHDTGTTTAYATPAPGGLTLACAGLVCVAPFVWLRRRKMALLAA